jgi:hypothetical protein
VVEVVVGREELDGSAEVEEDDWFGRHHGFMWRVLVYPRVSHILPALMPRKSKAESRNAEAA